MGLWELVASLRRDLARCGDGDGFAPSGWSWGGSAAWVSSSRGGPGGLAGRTLEGWEVGLNAEVWVAQG